MKRLIAMLELQQELNDATNGLGWESGSTNSGKIIDWRRCIYLESAELVESYPWKHWKNIDAQPDYDNIKIEAVDIWHFVMSEALRIYKIEDRGAIQKLAEEISKEPNFKLFTINYEIKYNDHYSEIVVVEEFIKSLFCNDSIEILIDKFFIVAIQSGLNLDRLYSLYIGKNILNQFRQNHGYKDGSYIKIWNGSEDNVIMQKILEQNSDIAPQELYSALEESYPQV